LRQKTARILGRYQSTIVQNPSVSERSSKEEGGGAGRSENISLSKRPLTGKAAEQRVGKKRTCERFEKRLKAAEKRLSGKNALNSAEWVGFPPHPKWGARSEKRGNSKEGTGRKRRRQYFGKA